MRSYRELKENFNILQEKLVLSDFKTYAAVVAYAYSARPLVQDGVKYAWDIFSKHNHKMFRQIESRVEVIFSDENPYENAAELTQDVDENSRLIIWTGESDHPFWTERENWVFRAVHDYLAHYGGKHDFTLRGEFSAYNRHAKVLPRDTMDALFVETAAQTAYTITFGSFGDQKGTFMYGFDYDQLGLVDPNEYPRNFPGGRVPDKAQRALDKLLS